MDTVLISCGTLEDEVRKVLAGMSGPPRLIFMEAAWHSKPTDQMRAALQKELDALGPEVRRVLMAYGLCGGAIKGLVTGNFTLIVPRVDDCIPLLLGSRQKMAAVSRIPSFFLTAGWIKFSNQNYYDTLNRLGERNTSIVYKMLLANYKRFLFIDNGAYDLPQAQANMADRLQRHNLPAEVTTGDLTWLTRLVTGPWPEQDFLTTLPHSRVCWDIEYIAENVAHCIPPAPQKSGQELIQNFSSYQKAPGKPQNLNNTGSPTVLGIDTGGTYTDGVIIDLHSRKILKKAKARTTHEDLTLGIQECIKKLEFPSLSQINVVALSTTLATNAVVEDKGCEVGLIMIGENPPDQLPAQQYIVVDGGHNGAGLPVKPLDEDGIIKAAVAFTGKVRAVAISSYFSVRNPEHELQAKEIVQKYLRLPIVCAHQLTTSLGFPDRTVTAVLNARLLPIIGDWLESIQVVLLQNNINAPLMIVRSDGSLTSIAGALEKPIETLLTGPAASIIGACNLSQKSDAIFWIWEERQPILL